MFVIVGLGNPGKKYENTRHNIGFMLIDALYECYGKTEWRKKFQGELSECSIMGQKVLLFKPQTYMNLSGHAVRDLVHFYKIPSEDLFVVYDDLDLNIGDLKVRNKGGAGGHNGIKSLLQNLPEHFVRIRVGIGHPGHRDQVTGYVLSPITKAELQRYESLNSLVAKNMPLLLQDKKSLFIENIKKTLQEQEGTNEVN